MSSVVGALFELMFENVGVVLCSFEIFVIWHVRAISFRDIRMLCF